MSGMSLMRLRHALLMRRMRECVMGAVSCDPDPGCHERTSRHVAAAGELDPRAAQKSMLGEQVGRGLYFLLPKAFSFPSQVP
jgi:hypothetical protein